MIAYMDELLNQAAQIRLLHDEKHVNIRKSTWKLWDFITNSMENLLS